MRNINKDDLRWRKGTYHNTYRDKMTYIETLSAMCNCYGTFGGRWHSNEFWARTKKELESMIEDEAKVKVFEIENDADTELQLWKQFQ